MRRRHQRPLLSKSARGGRAAVRLLTLTQSPQQPTENALHSPPPADDVAATRRNHGLWRPVNYSAEPTLSSAVMHGPPLIGRPHLPSFISFHSLRNRPISSDFIRRVQRSKQQAEWPFQRNLTTSSGHCVNIWRPGTSALCRPAAIRPSGGRSIASHWKHSFLSDLL